jgi:hypothetical protein
MARIYGITRSQITATIEERGYTYSLRGRTIRVANASGRRDHGEIFECRDGSWGHRLDGNAVRIWESLSKIGSSEPAKVDADAVDYNAIGRAIRAGTAHLHYTDEQIADAVRLGFASAGDASNQDF